MPEWLQDAASSGGELSWSLIAVRLVVSLLLGCVVAAVYWYSRRLPITESSPSLVPTLVLLTVIIAMVTLAIGDSAARAFALVGSLAIVRFRTVVDDTRDTAFVILAVAVGLSAGAGFLRVPLVGIPIAAIAAFLFSPRRASNTFLGGWAKPGENAPAATSGTSSMADDRSYQISLRCSLGHADETRFVSVLRPCVETMALMQVETARQGSALDLLYRVELRSAVDPVQVVAALNRCEGIQSVELRRGERAKS